MCRFNKFKLIQSSTFHEPAMLRQILQSQIPSSTFHEPATLRQILQFKIEHLIPIILILHSFAPIYTLLTAKMSYEPHSTSLNASISSVSLSNYIYVRFAIYICLLLCGFFLRHSRFSISLHLHSGRDNKELYICINCQLHTETVKKKKP